MRNAKVSAYIITYNRAGKISRAISSVLNQTFKDFELVVVDDGSDDNTKDVVASFADKRIRYFRKDHTGIPGSRNYAIDKCQGKWIAWLDSDDAYHNDYLEKHMTNLEGENEYNVSLCDFVNIYLDGSIRGRFYTEPFYIAPIKISKIAKKLLLYPRIKTCGVTTVCSKKLLKEVGGYELTYRISSDLDIAIKILGCADKFKSINQVLYDRYASLDDGISSVQNVEERAIVTSKLLRTTLEKIPVTYLFPELTINNNSKDYDSLVAIEKFKVVFREYYLQKFQRYNYENDDLRRYLLELISCFNSNQDIFSMFWGSMLLKGKKEELKFAIYGGGAETEFTMRNFYCDNLKFMGVINTYVKSRVQKDGYMVYNINDPLVKDLDIILLCSYLHEKEMEDIIKPIISNKATIIPIYGHNQNQDVMKLMETN